MNDLQIAAVLFTIYFFYWLCRLIAKLPYWTADVSMFIGAIFATKWNISVGEPWLAALFFVSVILYTVTFSILAYRYLYKKH